jgi:hypothetical protein
MPDTLRAFVNARAVEVLPGATALDAVRAWSEDAAREVVEGARVITDSRGLPLDSSAPVQAGSIYRLIPSRGGSINPTEG